MSINVPVFYQRTLSAIVFVVVMLTGLLWNGLSFFALLLVIQWICLQEFMKLCQKINPADYWPPWLWYIIQFTAIGSAAFFQFNNGHGLLSSLLFGSLLSGPAIGMLVSLLSRRMFFNAATQGVGGLLYINLPVIFLIVLRATSSMLPLYFIVLIWINDTMAYIVGSFIGKTPLSSISPNKTWEGTGGGALLTVATAVIYGFFSHTFALQHWAAMALIVSVTGTLGDLMESKLKRMADVKDSGRLMPGHGGALDRFDSLLMATPFVFFYAVTVMHLM
ncbi:MAG: phosphatidate cytidylyltransferase [Chitinophagia bacterium]|nr:phosphatidate cytidylyltransferase [Chitinophagia bacterium]